MLHRRLDRRPDRRPRWLPVDRFDPARHLQVRTVGRAHGVPWSAALRQFFSTPVALDAPPWQLEVVHDADTARTAVLAKLHHSLGDGLAVTATLIALLYDGHDARIQRGYSRLVHPAQPAECGTWGSRARRVRRMVRGLVSLASAGAAPGAEVLGASTEARDYVMIEFPAATVRATAREHGTGTTVLLLALVGEALHRADPTGTAAQDRLRVIAPRTTHAIRRAGDGGVGGVDRDGDYQGNRTAALALDLPVGPMPPTWRIVAVADALTRLERADQPVAARAVVEALGRLPAPLHARLVRLIYQRRYSL